MYAELHCHSNFSFLDGASHPADLAVRAKELGLPALALTNHDGLYGAVKFYRAAREAGIKPIPGAEMTLDGGFHLTLLGRDRTGYSSLCRLVSLAQLGHGKGQSSLDMETLSKHPQGLICLSGCKKGEVPGLLLAGKKDEALRAARKYLDIFGRENYFIELQNTLCPGDRRLCRDLAELARSLGIGCVATNNVHYATRDCHRLQDVLVAIKNRTTLDDSHRLRRPNSEFHLKPYAEMSRLFVDYPEAISNTIRIAEACNVGLDLSGYRFPDFPVPPGETAYGLLEKLCRQKIVEKYRPPDGEPERRLREELLLIKHMGLAGYFLTVWDIMEFAKKNGIPAQGRGSAASSIVTYLLGITNVDPVRHRLFAGRFLNDEMSSIPDIDIDIASDSEGHRERLIQYIYRRYGPHHTAMLCNVVTYRARNTVREVARAMGMSSDLVERMARVVESYSARGIEEDLSRLEEFRSLFDSGSWRQFLKICQRIASFPRHLGIHVGGMVIATSPLIDFVPVEHATMPGRTVTQWDKDDISDLGLIKIDLLGLRMLSLLDEAVKLVKTNRGIKLDLDSITLDDPAVYDMLCRGDTIGVFQVESRAQQATLPRSCPRCFDDIVAEVAIIRPGPIQGDAVHPYLNRRQGKEPVTYLHPSLKPILGETLGVIIYQEQVIQVAMAIAGFSPGQADSLRRAMSRRRSREAMEKLRGEFLDGARSNGIDRATAEKAFTAISGFAEFGFCKAHAAALAGTTYRSAWLKLYYPAEYYCALLNCQPMGFYSPGVIVNHARRNGIRVLPVNINRSGYRCLMEEGGIRLGLRYVKSVGMASWQRIEEERRNGPYLSLTDFYRRIGLEPETLANLIMAGAFDFTGVPRRRLLWESRPAGRVLPEELPLAYAEYPVALPEMTAGESLSAEYEMQGLSVRRHPMELYRTGLRQRGILTSRDIDKMPEGRRVSVAGCVVCRQKPLTAGGHVFITLEDETGLVNVILRPQVYDRFRQLARHEALLVVEGRLQKRDGVINVIAEVLSPVLPDEAGSDVAMPVAVPPARNFC